MAATARMLQCSRIAATRGFTARHPPMKTSLTFAAAVLACPLLPSCVLPAYRTPDVEPGHRLARTYTGPRFAVQRGDTVPRDWDQKRRGPWDRNEDERFRDEPRAE
jgi:hypothetical protein